ncbi:hypothetical protein CK203_104131 [Vitis vinifera]|uniref:Reverse transcriptase domain-containing protein n=1 Tax=Vitis vinifera TaxID=29760 RepID=A0A438FHQ0_VITVI|nr:hypothetical protein CK203_104131 [Vitis vinifera]
MVSTLQIKKGLKCGNVTYIIALVENKADQSIEVPHSVTHIQKEVKDMMPSKFPKELPPRVKEVIEETVGSRHDPIFKGSLCKTLEEHVNHLRLVFQRLREHELYVKKEKCEFTQRHITFLGRKIEEGLIKIDEAKVQAIKDWHVPSKVTLANYYRRHNVVVDALNQKELAKYVIALSNVISYFNEKIKQATKLDSTYEKMKQQVKEGATKKYWLEIDLLMVKRGRLYVPRSCLHKELLRDTYDVK